MEGVLTSSVLVESVLFKGPSALALILPWPPHPARGRIECVERNQPKAEAACTARPPNSKTATYISDGLQRSLSPHSTTHSFYRKSTSSSMGRATTTRMLQRQTRNRARNRSGMCRRWTAIRGHCHRTGSPLLQQGSPRSMWRSGQRRRGTRRPQMPAEPAGGRGIRAGRPGRAA